MQQLTSQAITQAGTYLTSLKQWWWPPHEAPPSAPIDLLKYYLAHSNVQYRTRHSEQKILVQRVAMMYGELVEAEAGRFRGFRPSIQKPVQEIGPIVKQEVTKGEENVNKSIVSITGQLKLKTQKLKCTLTITLILHSQIQSKLPTVLIRNPDPRKTQPNPEYTIKNNVYQSILGGVTLSDKEAERLENACWKEYRASNLLSLVQNLEKLLYQYFPFVKKYMHYEQLTSQQTLTKLHSLSSALKQSLPQIQNLLILKASLSSQHEHLKAQTQNLKQILQKNKTESENSNDIESILRIFKVTENEELMDLVCRERACLDCLRLLENQVEKQGKSQGYGEIAELVREWSARLFEVRFKIKDIVDKCVDGK